MRAGGTMGSRDVTRQQEGCDVELKESRHKAHQKVDEAAVNDMSAGRQGQGQDH